MTAVTVDKDTAKNAKPSKLEQLRARYPWLDHLVRAYTRYTEHHGDHYAAAITLFRRVLDRHPGRVMTPRGDGEIVRSRRGRPCSR